jgi:hypothetical protein
MEMKFCGCNFQRTPVPSPTGEGYYKVEKIFSPSNMKLFCLHSLPMERISTRYSFELEADATILTHLRTFRFS